MKQYGRRDFLRLLGIGTTALAVAPELVSKPEGLLSPGSAIEIPLPEIPCMVRVGGLQTFVRPTALMSGIGRPGRVPLYPEALMPDGDTMEIALKGKPFELVGPPLLIAASIYGVACETANVRPTAQPGSPEAK
jgi:hypothetical protein